MTDDARAAADARPAGTADPLVPPAWQTAVQDAVRDTAELERLLDLPPGALPAADTDFPLLVPRGFVARMRKGDPDDPLLRQIWPLTAELAEVPGYCSDPVEEQALAADGIIDKYPGRTLVVASATCPIHCRYCFRREFPYREQLGARDGFDAVLARVTAAPDVHEVILSGGDPLSLSNRRLGEFLDKLAATHVSTVRIHTRFPIAVPERIDAGLLGLLRSTRLRTVVVVHCNHANELAGETPAALRRLRGAVDALLNQSVLLAGVNDSADALAALSDRLFDCGVLPYYLHLLDRVAGAAHFDVAPAAASALVATLRLRLPGYLVPRLVRETPGELSKTPVG